MLQQYVKIFFINDFLLIYIVLFTADN